MADMNQTPAAGSTPTPEPTKPKQKHGLINKAHEQEIGKSEKVATAALKTEYNTRLTTDGEVAPAIIAALGTDCKSAREQTGTTVDTKTDKLSATDVEQTKFAALLALIRYTQNGARRKHGPIQQKDYFIGQKIDKNADLLIAAAVAIELKLSQETLPGVKPDTGANIAAARVALKGGDDTQTSETSNVSKKVITLGDLVKRIIKNRIEIQLAAEGLWPSHNPTNRPIRVEFQMPPDRPYVATSGDDTAPSAPPT